MQNASALCFIRPKPVVNPRLRLFCFPYAGGSAAIYHQWPTCAPADTEILAVQYPGRATRLRQAPLKDLNLLLDDIEKAIIPLLDRPFAFFGHSMGATVAYELTRRLHATQKALPIQLFLSGRSAPHLPTLKPQVHNLPDKEFLESMRDLNGTPTELLEHNELMEIMLPIIRADFQMLETWQHQASPPLELPISVFGGLSDDGVPLENLDAWSVCTTGKMKRHMFPGDHFFLHQQYPSMLNIINRALSSE
ncbi:MAG: thioesterase II family protein [Burkholderiaceae bacterium]